MHGRRTALRYSPSTPSPAGVRPRGRSTVLPFGRAGGSLHRRLACRWRCVGRRSMQLGLRSESPDTRILLLLRAGVRSYALCDCVCACGLWPVAEATQNVFSAWCSTAVALDDAVMLLLQY
jgi:hypothetical protein